MKQFTDAAGRPWSIEINATQIGRVRSLIDVDLLKVLEEPLLERLSTDTVLLVRVLYALCLKQIEERAISEEEFGEGLYGDVIDQATEALLDELVAFFPRARRQILVSLLTKLRALQTEVSEEVMDRMHRLDLNPILAAELAKADRELEERLAALLQPSAGS